MKHTIARRAAVAAVVAIAVLAGCADSAPRAKLTYETAPVGATLYEDGKALGVAPQMRTYTGEAGGAQIRTPEVTAVWPSGAKATFWTFLKAGDDNVTTITRPANAPNLQADLDNAKNIASTEERAKAGMLRDQKRSSARCLAQQQGGVVAGVDDCN